MFDSANPDFYLAHYDLENDPGRTEALGVGPTGLSAWIDVLVRLNRAPVVSIASIRGRARGGGCEFVLACDLRFASRENTLLGQWEVGVGVVPGGGPMAGLSRLVGRGRALEILLVADDLDGTRAEQYGYVNRLIADDQLDAEVEDGDWIADAALPDDVFTELPDELWSRVLTRKGGSYALIARMPGDPSVN